MVREVMFYMTLNFFTKLWCFGEDCCFAMKIAISGHETHFVM